MTCDHVRKCWSVLAAGLSEIAKALGAHGARLGGPTHITGRLLTAAAQMEQVANPYSGQIAALLREACAALQSEAEQVETQAATIDALRRGLPRVDILRTIPAAVRFLSVEPLLEDLGPLDLSGIHWVIIGGESGSGARPFDIGWAESIVDQCKAQQVPVFLKQLGAAPTSSFGDMPVKIRLKSKKGSDESEWPPHLRGLKQFPVWGVP